MSSGAQHQEHVYPLLILSRGDCDTRDCHEKAAYRVHFGDPAEALYLCPEHVSHYMTGDE